MENEIVVGLDIGTTKICTIVGRRNEFGKIDILGYGKSESLGVTRGVVTNIVNTIASIKKSIEEASGRSDVDIHNVFVGIAGQHIKSLQHHGMRTRSSSDDEITQADIDAIVADMYKLAMP
ncbi:MAG TPA: cell division protein FtsA, partial [Bacteroidia bacterium]|nr:cell division protein FtsA [Bacteroidia bacterium]